VAAAVGAAAIDFFERFDLRPLRLAGADWAAGFSVGFSVGF
jgi:hypothetical protein